MKNELGIYVHIPFCSSKCYYCDFNSYAGCDDSINSYIDALCSEILSKADILSEAVITSIYFGGGTPSYIDSKYIEKILNILKLFNIREDAEITIEVNPNSTSIDKLKNYKKNGINRVSIGLQTPFDDILKVIGRKHTRQDFIRVARDCSLVGLNNISCDLIYPLPNLSFERFKEGINDVVTIAKDYDIKHISVYNLEVHENTKLKFLLDEGFLSLVDEDEEYKMRRYLNLRLEENDFNKYEISNFAKSGYESKHNLSYWDQKNYFGFGAGASSFIGSSRYTNPKNIKKYISGVNSGSIVPENREDMDTSDLMKEYVILRLRLSSGVIFKEFEKRFNTAIFDVFSDEINNLAACGLLVKDSDKIYLSDRGQEVANIVWEKFI